MAGTTAPVGHVGISNGIKYLTESIIKLTMFEEGSQNGVDDETP
jgi:hypothetical protein